MNGLGVIEALQIAPRIGKRTALQGLVTGLDSLIDVLHISRVRSRLLTCFCDRGLRLLL